MAEPGPPCHPQVQTVSGSAAWPSTAILCPRHSVLRTVGRNGGRRNFHPLKCSRSWAHYPVAILLCSKSCQAYSRCLMHVFLFPAPSLSFLGQEQVCGLLCMFGGSALKAVNGMGLGFWAPARSPFSDWFGLGHLLGEKEEGGPFGFSRLAGCFWQRVGRLECGCFAERCPVASMRRCC